MNKLENINKIANFPGSFKRKFYKDNYYINRLKEKNHMIVLIIT